MSLHNGHALFIGPTLVQLLHKNPVTAVNYAFISVFELISSDGPKEVKHKL